MVVLSDKKLTCVDCKKEFVFSSGEQEYYLKKALDEPKRCNDCRVKRRKDKRQRRKNLIKRLKVSENVDVNLTKAEDAAEKK